MAGLNNSGLESHPDGTGNLNSIVNANWEALEGAVNPAIGLTASQSGTTVTASAALFTNDNIGDEIVFGSGESGTITAVGSATAITTCTVGVSQTVASVSFRLQPAATDAKTMLARGLVKATDPDDVLADGDSIKWDTTAQKFISGGVLPANLGSVDESESGVNATIFGAGGVRFSGTSGERISKASSGVDLADRNFTMRFAFRVPTANPATARGIGGSGGSTLHAGGDSAAFAQITTSGELLFQVNNVTSGSNNISLTFSTLVSSYGGKVVDCMLVRDYDGATARIYINGDLQSATEATNGTGTWQHSIGDNLHIGVGNAAANVFEGEFYGAQFFTVAFTDTEAAEIHLGDIPAELIVGAIANAYTSDFSATADGWTAENGTVDGNIDAIGSRDDTLRMFADATSGQHGAQKASILTANKRYRIDYEVYIPSGSTTLDGVDLRDDAGDNDSAIAHATITTKDAWQDLFHDFVAPGTGIGFYGLNSGGSDSWAGANSSTDDEFHIRDIKIRQVGLVAHVDLAFGRGRFFPDLTVNRIHLNGESGVESLVDRTPSIDDKSSDTFGATMTIDMEQDGPEVLLPTADQDFTIDLTNIKKGREVTVYIPCDSTSRTPTVDASWQAVGSAVAALTASKTAVFVFKAVSGDADADIIYSFANGV